MKRFSTSICPLLREGELQLLLAEYPARDQYLAQQAHHIGVLCSRLERLGILSAWVYHAHALLRHGTTVSAVGVDSDMLCAYIGNFRA